MSSDQLQSQQPLLSPIQKKLVSLALVLLALNLIGGIFVGLFLILRQLVSYFSDVLWPLAIAGILALLLRPLVLLAQRKLRVGRIGSILLLYLLVAGCIVTAAWSLLPEVVRQVIGLLEQLPAFAKELQVALAQRFPELHDRINTWAQNHEGQDVWELTTTWLEDFLQWSLPAVGAFGEKVTRIFALAAGTAIIPVYLFFFLLTDRNPLRDLERQLSFIPASAREDLTFLLGEFARIMVSFFRGQILIGLIMGGLMAIGFSLAGLNFGFLLGIAIGLLNIIPYLGSILGLLIVLPLAHFQADGGLTLVLIVAAIFAAVQLLESYFLTPKIMGRSTGLHPLLIIIAIFFWGKALGGLLGMILAIPLTAFFVVFWRLLHRKYLTPATEKSWPARTHPMKIIVLGDLHLISPSDKDHAGRQRRKHFAEAWRSFDAVVAAVVREAPDLVISVGDLVDYYSRENRDFAIEQMNRLQTAWMVTPGNHDFAQNYAKDDPEEAKSSIDAIRCDWAKAGVRMDNRSIEADGARVLLVDSHNSGVAENTDEWIRKEVEGSARNILITHVPLSTPEMRAHILEIEPERNLLKYVQSKAPDLFHSAVAGRVTTVISGHLHFSATLSVDGTQMYVLPLSIQAFGKSYRDQGRISIIDTAAHPIQVQHLQLRSF